MRPHLPVVLGRSPQATFCVDDSRVSRSHARIDWHGGTFQLTDLSYNGTYVRFCTTKNSSACAAPPARCTARRDRPRRLAADPASPSVRFDVLSIVDTVPHLD